MTTDPQAGMQVEQSLTSRQHGGRRLRYLFFSPRDDGAADARRPLILFLHGRGECGSTLSMVKALGPPRLVESDPDFPFVVVSPQCPREHWWNERVMLDLCDELLDAILARGAVDPARVYLTGVSMGGFGTFALAARTPERFAAALPICGGGDPRCAERLKTVPLWVFHGARDNIVPLSCSEEMVEAVRRAGGNVTFTVYPDAEHDSWTETYANPEIYRWLLEHTRSDGTGPL